MRETTEVSEETPHQPASHLQAYSRSPNKHQKGKYDHKPNLKDACQHPNKRLKWILFSK